VPPDSDLAKEAQALLADETGYVRQRRQAEIEAFMQGCVPGHRFAGEWTYELAQGFGIGVSADIQKVIQRKQGSKGKLVLAIEGCDPNTYAVTGLLYDPDSPNVSRPVSGAIQPLLGKHQPRARPEDAHDRSTGGLQGSRLSHRLGEPLPPLRRHRLIGHGGAYSTVAGGAPGHGHATQRRQPRPPR